MVINKSSTTGKYNQPKILSILSPALALGFYGKEFQYAHSYLFLDNSVVDHGDVDLNLDDSAKGPVSTGGRRRQNTSRRSAPGDSKQAAIGNDSDEEEIDVKKMKANFDESKQIMALVEEIEEDYFSSKKEVNSFDTSALYSDCKIKTLKKAYRIVKENLYKDNPNFDQEKCEATIHQLK